MDVSYAHTLHAPSSLYTLLHPPPPPLHAHRPCDGNETAGVYKVAIENIYKQNPAGIVRPSTMVLSRQNLPNQPGSSIEKTSKGGYVIYGDENEKPDVIVIATGMCVQLGCVCFASVAAQASNGYFAACVFNTQSHVSSTHKYIPHQHTNKSSTPRACSCVLATPLHHTHSPPQALRCPLPWTVPSW